MRHSGEDHNYPFPILIGDIGGTNARFAILTDAYAEPKAFPSIGTADFATIDEAIQSSVLDRTSVQPKTAILAVAGPIDGDEIELRRLRHCDTLAAAGGEADLKAFSLERTRSEEPDALVVIDVENMWWHASQAGSGSGTWITDRKRPS